MSLKQLPVLMHNPKEEMMNEEEKPKPQHMAASRLMSWGFLEGKALLLEWHGWVSWLLTVPGLTQRACLG